MFLLRARKDWTPKKTSRRLLAPADSSTFLNTNTNSKTNMKKNTKTNTNTNTKTKTNTKTNARTTDRPMILYVFGKEMTIGV